MAADREVVVGLIKTDMPIVADTEQLDVNAAAAFDQRVIPAAFLFGVIRDTRRNMGLLRGDIHMVKQIFLHEPAVALRVVTRKPAVFIQIEGLDMGEIKCSILITADQLLIEADRSGTGCETEDTGGIPSDFIREDVRGLFTDTGISLKRRYRR